MAVTPGGGGYWLVASDGGIFSYGGRNLAGSAGSLRLNTPVVGMAATPSGGYWLVAHDGGIFTYGEARFEGSAGSLALSAPVTGMAASSDGGGYWLVSGTAACSPTGTHALLRVAGRDDAARPGRGPGRRVRWSRATGSPWARSPWPARWSGSTRATTAETGRARHH